MSKCPEPRRIPANSDAKLVYVDFAWTSMKWSGTLIQISAVHEDETLNVFVQPSSFDKVDEKKLLEFTGLEWIGSSLKKNGNPVPADQVLEPLNALVKLLSWLGERKPVIIMSFDFMLKDSLQLLRLLRSFGLLGKFGDICFGFVCLSKVLQDWRNKGKSRIDILRRTTGNEHASLPDPTSLRTFTESQKLTHEQLLQNSYDLHCLDKYEKYREEMYQKTRSYELMCSKEILSNQHIRRLAFDGVTFQDLVALFLNDGKDELAARLGDVIKGPLCDSTFFRTNPEELDDTVIEKVCEYFVKTFGTL